MVRARRSFVCRECGAESPAWAGRCSRCEAWGSVEEVDVSSRSGSQSRRAGPVAEAEVFDLASLAGVSSIPTPTGLDEIDRVLGGGLTAGSAILLGGEPGVGKSTLTLQLALAVAQRGAAALIVAGEEAPAQIAARAARLGDIPDSLSVIDSTAVESVIAAMEQVKPLVAIIDSIQTVRVGSVDGSPGSVRQLKAATEEFATAARRLGVTVLMVGHVTKDGALAGPRVIEHLVDTVLSFGGDRSGELRYLRAVKHRYGPTTEVGLFEMTAAGLAAVSDPSGRFLVDRQVGLPGSVVLPTLEGRRPILVEVQALAVRGQQSGGHVTVQGIDSRRLAMVAAVLAMRAKHPLAAYDLFVSSTGGMAVTEPGADLALAVALVSAVGEFAVSGDLVACGEIGLGGELRSVPQLELRLQEAYRLGFRTALVPASAPDGPTGMEIVRADTVAKAMTMIDRKPWLHDHL